MLKILVKTDSKLLYVLIYACNFDLIQDGLLFRTFENVNVIFKKIIVKENN